MGQVKTGGLLFSSQLRFARPFFKKQSGEYYLRDIFSIRAWRQASRFGYVHVLPKYYAVSCSKSDRSFQADRMVSQISRYFDQNNFFTYQQINVWPLIRKDFLQMARRCLAEGLLLIDRFAEMLQCLAPKAVVVDEEVTPFNKTLVQTANSLGVPTLCFEHGAPVESVGSVPSSATVVLVWGDPSREQLRSWGVPDKKIRLTGAPQLMMPSPIDVAEHRKSVFSKFDIKTNERLLLLATYTMETNEVPTFLRTTAWIEAQSAALLVACGLIQANPDMHLFVKFHYADQHAEFSSNLIAKRFPELRSRIHLISHYDSGILLDAADFVMAGATTMYFEALLRRKPVFLLDQGKNRYASFFSQDFIDLDDPSKCIADLQAHLTPEGIAATLDRQRHEISRHFFNENKVAVDTVLRILRDISDMTA